MNPILITPCSSRKKTPAGERLNAQDLPTGSLKEVASVWRRSLKCHQHRLRVGDLYHGRGAFEAYNAASRLKADHWFISAGLGLVGADEEVPAYDLTVSGAGNSSIKSKILDKPFRSSDWWHEISKRKRPTRTVARLIENNPDSTVVLALPTNYLDMIYEDLYSVNPESIASIRLIGPPSSRVPDFLKPCWMPYDDRLDGQDSPLRGTRSDFPQRAARHFAEVIWPLEKQSNAETHGNLVTDALALYRPPDIPKRTPLADEALINKIKALWDKADGRSGRMLRILRDDELIACEQGRFKNLFSEARKQLREQ